MTAAPWLPPPNGSTPMRTLLTATLGPGAVVADDGVCAEAARPTFHDVYREHWHFVWRALRAHGVREADLEDQVHEVFLVVHRKLEGFEGRSQVTTWLWGIVERVASDWRRRAHVRREESTADVPEPAQTSADAGEARLDHVRGRATLESILDTMPADQRAVFVLFELDAVPVDEIGRLVNCPVNTVWSRLRLARKHFERALARVRARGGP